MPRVSRCGVSVVVTMDMPSGCIDRSNARERTCRSCGTGLVGVPYECWLFSSCEYCAVDSLREYDAHR